MRQLMDTWLVVPADLLVDRDRQSPVASKNRKQRMSRHPPASEQSATPPGMIALLLVTVIFTELAVTELIAPLFSTWRPIFASGLDAGIITLIYAIPVWLFIVSPQVEIKGAEESGLRRARIALYLKTLSVIFLGEFLAMLIVSRLMPGENPHLRGMIDAFLSILFCAFPLWGLLSRLETGKCKTPLTGLLMAPLKLYVILLFIVFLADLLQDEFIPNFFPKTSVFPHKYFDAFLTTLLAAPFLWLFVTRPLQKTALREKARSSMLQAQLVDALVTTDAAGRIVLFNSAAEIIFGYQAAEVTGKNAVLLFYDEQKNLEGLVGAAPAGDDNGDQLRSYEMLGRRRDGSTLIMDVSISKILQEEGPEFLLILRDITARKDAETLLRENATRFRQLFEQSEDSIIFFKPGTCSIIDLNVTAEKLFGYTKAELHALGLECLSRATDFGRLSNLICTMRGDEIAYLDRMVNLCKDGTEIIVSVRCKMIELQGVAIVYCTFRDISERIRMEEEGRAFQAKLIQANKMTSLGILVSGVAHEINNPNNFIMASSQLLTNTWEDAMKILREYYRENGEFFVGGVPFSKLDAQSPKLFAGILDGSHRINEIVTNLKSFARQERSVTERDGA
jgi:PAS domain S-box-containing protein